MKISRITVYRLSEQTKWLVTCKIQRLIILPYSIFNWLAFHSIRYYQGVCTQLAEEKNQLEANKHHIREGLSQLQTEIQGNSQAVRSLQSTVERLQLVKKKMSNPRLQLKKPQACDSVSQVCFKYFTVVCFILVAKIFSSSER